MIEIPAMPAELRRNDTGILPELCAALRSELSETVKRVGGHLGSSLGTVELSVALHYVFDTPRDVLVWDTGHQGYVHKMLTGRRDALERIRKQGGISGYLKRSESEYDAFGAGHAGTSISAAIGQCIGLRVRGSSAHVVAIIGDGALTAGMAFEALNHLGALQLKNFTLILNDNGMSIADNVGALHQRSQGSSLKSFFESFNLKYMGPLDGHNVPGLLAAMQAAKSCEGPAVLHIKTKKGMGLPEAEQDAQRLHAVNGIRPLQLVKARAYSDAFGSAMSRIAREDKRVAAVSAAMPDGAGLSGFASEFPERFFDVGICEQHAVTFAAGLACQGLRPVCAIYSTFLQRGFDQLLHDVCLQNLPVIFALDRSGVVGNDGETHQGLFDIAYLRSIPNLTLMSPKDEHELQHMLYSAFQYGGPVAIRYPRGQGIGGPESPAFEALPYACSEMVRGGRDALIVALGPYVQTALEVSREAERRGISVAVLNARFAKPLDEPLLRRLLPGFPVVCTLEDHMLSAGFSSALLEFVNDGGIPMQHPLRRFGVGNCYVSHASQEEQRRAHGLDVNTLLNTILEIQQNKGSDLHRPHIAGCELEESGLIEFSDEPSESVKVRA